VIVAIFLALKTVHQELVLREWGEYKERIRRIEYGVNVMYSCMQKEKWNLLKLF
jgi:hypothetical protein